MSKPGDVVWADGLSWQRDEDSYGKLVWYTPTRYPDGTSVGTYANYQALKQLKKHKDFRWLVKDGKLATQSARRR